MSTQSPRHSPSPNARSRFAGTLASVSVAFVALSSVLVVESLVAPTTATVAGALALSATVLAARWPPGADR